MDVLSVATVFPRAGEINHKVLDFVDLCVAIWEKGGQSEDEASWVIEVSAFLSLRNIVHLFYMP